MHARILKCFKWLIFAVCILTFIYLLISVKRYQVLTMDTVVYDWIARNLISDRFTPIVKIVTHFGGQIVIVILTILAIILLKNKKIATSVVVNIVLVAIMNQVAKHLIQRPRPIGFRLIEEGGYSFPSGHSMASMAFYGFLIYLLYTRVKSPWIKWVGIVCLSILIVVIGLSRIYLGVHYASDVLAGFVCSLAFLIVHTSIMNRYMKKEL